MDTIKRKYPRTPHFNFSKSITDDDIIAAKSHRFLKEDVGVVITEKMDGENTTFYRDYYHARSIDSRYHESRSVAAQKHGEISWMIPEYRRIILENVYAEHSIKYNNLDSFIYGIAVIDLLDNNGNPSISGMPTFLSWDDTIKIFDSYGIIPVPAITSGVMTLGKIEKVFNKQDHDIHEGIVARSLDSFLEEDFSLNVAKAVRTGHVQTDEHWTRSWVPNKLKK